MMDRQARTTICSMGPVVMDLGKSLQKRGGEVVERGRYTTLELGEPKQKLEADLDMLRPDFYTIMTTSGEGSKYDTFLSSTHSL